MNTIVLMKHFLPLFILTGLLFGQENGLSQQEFTEMCTVMVSSGILPEGFDIEFRFHIHDKNKDGYVDAEELTEMMQTSLGKKYKSMIIQIARESAKEDFNTGLNWSTGSIVAFISSTYIGFEVMFGDYDKFLNIAWPIASWGVLIGPLAVSYLKPVKIPAHRFLELEIKNEEYQNAYRTAYDGVIRNERLKYSLIGTGFSTVVFGSVAALSFVAIFSVIF